MFLVIPAFPFTAYRDPRAQERAEFDAALEAQFRHWSADPASFRPVRPSFKVRLEMFRDAMAEAGKAFGNATTAIVALQMAVERAKKTPK